MSLAAAIWICMAPAAQGPAFPATLVNADPAPCAVAPGFPGVLAAGDLDQDGRIDVAAAQQSYGVVTLLHGEAGGAFIKIAAPCLTTAAPAAAVLIRDVDGDGIGDLVTADGAANSVTVRLGPCFAPTGGAASAWPAGVQPCALALADLDQNGLVDYVALDAGATALASGETITVGLQTSPGVFQTLAPLALHPSAGPADAAWKPAELLAADFDHDGALDLVVCYSSVAKFTWLRGLGGGAFAAPADVASTAVLHADAADLNADGFTDVAIAPNGSNTAPVYYNQSGAGFAASASVAGLNGPLDVRAGDFNGDGVADLAFADYFLGQCQIAAGSGTSFAAPASVLCGGFPKNIIAFDADGDGRLDLLASIPASDSVSVMLGGGGPAAATIANFSPIACDVGDFNRDGRADVVAVSTALGAQGVGLLFGDGAGALAAPVIYSMPPGAAAVAAGDVNSDHRLDVVTAGLASVSIRLGAPLGMLGAATTLSAGPAGTQAVDVLLADVNGDGLPDVATCDQAANPLGVLIGKASNPGAFNAVQNYAFAPAQCTSVRVADADLDGDLDYYLANASAAGPSLVLWLNGGTGAPAGAPMIVFTGADAPTRVAVADYDGDGVPDAAVSASASSKLLLFHGVAGGAPTFAGSLAAHSSPQAVAFGDLDRDGLVDLTAACRAAHCFDTFYHAPPPAAFVAQAASAGTGLVPSSLSLVDLDADGRTDVVTACVASYAVAASKAAAYPQPNINMFGTGTPGCSGRLGAFTHGAPAAGNATFTLSCTNAPASALGLTLVTDAADPAGSDPFFLGIKLHVSLVGASVIYGFDARSDVSGAAVCPLPIPNNPALIGLAFDACHVFAEKPPRACSGATAALITSKGLAFTIQ